MDRCEVAYQYHKEGYNCAQSVVGAFLDQLDLTKEQAMAIAGGFGGGVGGSHDELCGAISGGVIVLGLLHPYVEGADKDAKRKVGAVTKEFRRRFAEAFDGLTRCGELLRLHPEAGEKTAAAFRMGVTTHCDVLIITAVEIVETMLREEKQ